MVSRERLRSAAAVAIVLVLAGPLLAFYAVHARADYIYEWPVVDTMVMTTEQRRALRLPQSVDWHSNGLDFHNTLWNHRHSRNMTTLVDDMRSLMKRHSLSCVPASYVGVPLRVVAIKDGTVLINPRIRELLGSKTRETHTHFKRVEVDAATSIVVSYVAESFLTYRESKFDGWRATCVQMAMSQF